MEAVINTISQNCSIIDDFLDNGSDQVIESLYYLFMHHGVDLEYFIKKLFHKGFQRCDSLFFRQNIIEFTIIADFVSRSNLNTNSDNNNTNNSNSDNDNTNVNSNNIFDPLSLELAKLAEAENTSKMNVNRKDSNETPRTRHRKKEKLIVTKAINLLDKMMIDVVSDIFVDFCAYMCTFLNGHYKNDKTLGEKLICSFIIFRIITPRTIKLSSSVQLQHVLPIIKILNSIAHGECDETYSQEHERLRNIVARILMTRKKAEYIRKNILPEAEYTIKSNILIDEFNKNPLKYEHIESIKNLLDDKVIKIGKMIKIKNISAHELSKSLPRPVTKQELGLPRQGYTLAQVTKQELGLPRQGINPGSSSSRDWTLPRQEIKATVNFNGKIIVCPKTSGYDRPDFKYFILWNTEDVAELVETASLDKSFIMKWHINGKNYLQLTEEVMSEMGLDAFQINAFIDHISMIKKDVIHDIASINKNILKWNCHDLCIWLALSDLDYLIDKFIENNMTCMKLLRMDSDAYISYGILYPHDITKIIALKKMM